MAIPLRENPLLANQGFLMQCIAEVQFAYPRIQAMDVSVVQTQENGPVLQIIVR